MLAGGGVRMSSPAPKGGPQEATADWFRAQFEKDLRFFQLFLLLINKSCPIKRVDLVWAEDGPAGRAGLRQKLVCTEEALAGPCARLLTSNPTFEPVFCNRIEDCAASDKAAEKRVRKSGKGEAYRCHAGLIDIAVPVFADGQHIATLLSGQVRREPPTEIELESMRRKLESRPDLEWDAVRDSYWRTPVVSDSDIEGALQVLGVFAEYLGNTWSRLTEAIKGEQRRSRELHLTRQEFAYIALEGAAADRSTLKEMMGSLGLKRAPNRVLVVKVEHEGDCHAAGDSFELAWTRAAHSVEEVCESVPNTTCAYLRNRGICVFFLDRVDGGKAASFHSQSLAGRILRAIARRDDLGARIGIGGVKTSWQQLVDSYHEAGVALAASGSPIVSYSTSLRKADDLTAAVGAIGRRLGEGRLQDARSALAGLPLQVKSAIGELQAQRNFYLYALQSLCYAARAVLPRNAGVEQMEQTGSVRLAAAPSAFALEKAFSCQAETVLDAARQAFSGRREKLIERTLRMIHEELDNPATAPHVSVSRIAAAAGMSAGYLGRVFRREVGTTLERYLMTKRVELSKRALLDPLNPIASVAEQVGYSDPAYYAKVFRKIAGCSPTEYRENPASHIARDSTPRAS